MADQQNLPTITHRDLNFYTLDASVIPDNARELLIKYSGIPADKVNDHVDAIRKKAFAIFPYPCIGSIVYRFLELGAPNTGIYDEIIQRIKGGEKFLDLGCCFGQEIRKLIADGAPAANCYGSDLLQSFIDLGYDLFQDREGKEGSKITFLAANIFDDDSRLNELNGQISIAYTGSFFHLFSWQEQFDVAKRLVSILKPEPGAILCGRQVGNENPGEFEARGYAGTKFRYRHDVKTWTDLWEEVGEATGTRWQVDATLDERGVGFGEIERKLTEGKRESGARRLRFVVKRL